MVVESINTNQDGYKMYRDYSISITSSASNFPFHTAKESFQSLMERENITGFDKYAVLIKSK